MADVDAALLLKWRTTVSKCYGQHEHPTLYQRNGIHICDEWLGEHGFENFKAWALSTGYKTGLFIDRIDTYGDYCPENCRWVTQKENNRNRRDTVYVEYKGKREKLCELCERLNVPSRVVYSRIKSGWDIEKALQFNEPYKPRRHMSKFQKARLTDAGR